MTGDAAWAGAVGAGAVGAGAVGVAERGRGEDGFAGGFEGLLFGMLLFVAGTLLIAYAWGVVDTKTATDQAARQAVRTFVEAPDAATASAVADQAAEATLAGYGRDPSDGTVRLVAGQFARCSRVTIEVSYPAPLVRLPWFGSYGTGETVHSEESSIVDAYRSGLSGTAECG